MRLTLRMPFHSYKTPGEQSDIKSLVFPVTWKAAKHTKDCILKDEVHTVLQSSAQTSAKVSSS